jgi:hypothetical protein
MTLFLMLTTLGFTGYGCDQGSGGTSGGGIPGCGWGRPTDPDTDTGTNTNTMTNTDTGTETGTVTNTDTGTETGTVTDTDTGTETGTVTDTDTGTETGTVTDTDTGTETGTVTDTDTGTETGTVTDTDTGTETGTVTDTDTDTDDGTFRVNDDGKITKNGEELPAHCGAWFGLEGRHEPETDPDNPGGAPMELFIGNMWWNESGRTIDQTMEEITAEGFTMIRLPIAPETLDPDDPQGQSSVFKNAESERADNARAAMEEFIVKADEHDLQVIVDIHSCSNYVGWRAGRLDDAPPWVDADRDNYDFTREDYSCEYDKSQWLEDLKEIAGLSEELGVDNIMAIDIFNEPWNYTWQEWKALAESAYEAINSVNSDVLIMVEGIGSELDDGTKVANGDEDLNPNWGENLYSVGDDPLDIPKSRLILSPHTYGPSVFVQRQFMEAECEGMEGDEAGDNGCNIVIDPAKLEQGWEEHFGYLAGQGYAIIVGEFGGNMDWPENAPVRDQDRWGHITDDVDRQWQEALVDYLVKKDIQGCYWAINPESGDAGGLYGHQYDPVSATDMWGTWTDIQDEKMQLLKKLWGN